MTFFALGTKAIVREVHSASYETGKFLAHGGFARLGPFDLLCDSEPQTGIPAVAWRIKEGANPGYTLFDVADRLRVHGWQVPAYTLTTTDLPRTLPSRESSYDRVLAAIWAHCCSTTFVKLWPTSRSIR